MLLITLPKAVVTIPSICTPTLVVVDSCGGCHVRRGSRQTRRGLGLSKTFGYLGTETLADHQTGSYTDYIYGDLSSTQSLNPYVYVRNSPTVHIDPTRLTDEGDTHQCSLDQFCGEESVLDVNGDPVVPAGGDLRGFNPEAGQYNPSSIESSASLVEPSVIGETQTTLDQFSATSATADLVDTSHSFGQIEGGSPPPSAGWQPGDLVKTEIR